MKEILIETLTPVHIGSGRILLGGTEHIPFKTAGVIAVLDDRKILETIGESNISKWVAAITAGTSIYELLTAMRSTLKPEDVSLRLIKGSHLPAQENSIREQILTVQQKPIIPGSSLKGSLRTAWFSREVLKKGPLSKREISTEKHGKIKYSDENLKREILGGNPNQDLFRLLRLDDYIFDHTECLKSETLNLRGKGWEMKDAVSQFIECIPTGSYSRGRLQEATDLKKSIKTHGTRENQLPGMESFSILELLSRANEQTLAIINKEIRLWEQREENLPKGATHFLTELYRLKQEAEACKNTDGAAVIRLGFGSGHDSLTGGWQSVSLGTELQKEVANAVRRNSKYEGLEFPKSRRLVNNGTPLGFIRLTLMGTSEIDGVIKSYKDKAESAKREIEKAIEIKLAEELERQEAARKPIPFNGKLKPNIKLEGTIVRLENNLGIAEFEVNGERMEALVRRLNNPDIGSIIVVLVAQLPLGKLKEVNFERYKK